MAPEDLGFNTAECAAGASLVGSPVGAGTLITLDILQLFGALAELGQRAALPALTMALGFALRRHVDPPLGRVKLG